MLKVLARDNYGMLFVKDKHADAKHKHGKGKHAHSKTCHNGHISALGNGYEYHQRMAANIEANKEEEPAAIKKPVPTKVSLVCSTRCWHVLIRHTDICIGCNTTEVYACNTMIYACNTMIIACNTMVIACNTMIIACNTMIIAPPTQ